MTWTKKAPTKADARLELLVIGQRFSNFAYNVTQQEAPDIETWVRWCRELSELRVEWDAARDRLRHSPIPPPRKVKR